MKKLIITIALALAIASPFTTHAQVLMGDAYTDQIQPMEQIAELRLQLISLLTQLINALQAQLQAIQAQQPQTENVASGAQNSPTITMPQEQYDFQPTIYYTKDNNNQHAAFVISDPEAKCRLVVKDQDGNIFTDNDAWFKDKDNHMRQVMDLDPGKNYSYDITCSKGDLAPKTVSGDLK